MERILTPIYEVSNKLKVSNMYCRRYFCFASIMLDEMQKKKIFRFLKKYDAPEFFLQLERKIQSFSTMLKLNSFGGKPQVLVLGRNETPGRNMSGFVTTINSPVQGRH